MPLLTETRVLSPFGMRVHPVTKEDSMHTGVDLYAHFVPVYSYDEGVIARTGQTDTMGKYICVAHGADLHTWYLHLSEIFVEKGEYVGRQWLLGRTGDTGRVTGAHLHFEIRYRGEAVDPMIFSPISTAEVTVDGIPYRAVYNHKDELMYVEVREFAKALGGKTKWTPQLTEVEPVLRNEIEKVINKYKKAP